MAHWIAGINVYHGDVAAVVLRDGRLVAAAEEERFRRVKHCSGFPREALRRCLELAGVTAAEVDTFAVSRDPTAHLWRKALFALRHRQARRLMRERWNNAAAVRYLPKVLGETLGIAEGRVRARLVWVEHHAAHLASAFFVSPFDEAAVCAIDGFGDFVSTSWAVGRGRTLRILRRTWFPHSLGLLYLGLTQYLGFLKYGDEYKVMGLAAYGAPELADRLRRLIHLKGEGQFEVDLRYFRHWSDGVSMTWADGEPAIQPVFTRDLEQLLGPARAPDEPLTDRHAAIAASVQVVFEEAAFHVLNALHRRTLVSRLCLAGGCAMNSVMNGKIRERTPFKEVYIQPAAADNGTALGAAFHAWHLRSADPRRFVMDHPYWGPAFDDGALAAAVGNARCDIERRGCVVQTFGDEDRLCRTVAERLAEGQIVGWFQGRMEWGARALGKRSILADPRRADVRETINAKIKFRERFRPFAPSILEEAVEDYFVGAVPDPFMIQVYPVRPDKRSVIPAVTHVDGTGRLHAVSRDRDALYWLLIKEFEKLTGVPVVLNTSFNENEPIVHRPEEALDCFLRTDMDVLVLGRILIDKRPVPLA